VPKYRPSDDGKVIEGKIVVFLPLTRADSPRASGASAAQERQATAAAAQAATLASAARDAVPLCEECEKARRELDKPKGS
jgi:hypothetical protein